MGLCCSWREGWGVIEGYTDCCEFSLVCPLCYSSPLCWSSGGVVFSCGDANVPSWSLNPIGHLRDIMYSVSVCDTTKCHHRPSWSSLSLVPSGHRSMTHPEPLWVSLWCKQRQRSCTRVSHVVSCDVNLSRWCSALHGLTALVFFYMHTYTLCECST